MKINAHLLEIIHEGTRDDGGQYGARMTFRMRMRRKSKTGSGEEINLTLVLPEWMPMNVVRAMKKSIKQLVEIRERALESAKEIEIKFKAEAKE